MMFVGRGTALRRAVCLRHLPIVQDAALGHSVRPQSTNAPSGARPSLAVRMRLLRQELKTLEKGIELEEKARSSDPDLEGQLFQEETLDEFFQALHAPPVLTSAEEQSAKRLQSSRRSEAVRRLPTLFSGSFQRRIAADLDGDPQRSHRTDQLWSRLREAEAANTRLADETISSLTRLAEELKNEATTEPETERESAIPPFLRPASDAKTLLSDSEAFASGLLPTGLVTVSELAGLATTAVRHEKPDALTTLLEAAKHLDVGCEGMPSQLAVMNAAAQALSKLGRPDSVLDIAEVASRSECHDLMIAELRRLPTLAAPKGGIVLDDQFRHALILAFLNTDRADDALRSLEMLEHDKPAAIGTYTTVFLHLFKTKDSEKHAQAWSTYSRMRLCAHSIPDANTYSVMIRACADGKVPDAGGLRPPGCEAERALDLFREMTIGYNLRPTVEAFNATIRACSKSQDLFGEGLKLYKQMVELARSGAEHCTPDRNTFNALLLGCSKRGDLARARWLFGEMLRLAGSIQDAPAHAISGISTRLPEILSRLPDERTLAHLFATYASYVPPKRTLSPARASEKGDVASAQHASTETAKSAAAPESTSLDSTEHERSTHRPLPQTSKEVLSEVGRILDSVSVSDGLLPLAERVEASPWVMIRPSVEMLNAYLHVLCAHLPRSQRLLTVSGAVFSAGPDCLFKRFRLEPKLSSCEIVMRLCNDEPDRSIADAHANSIRNEFLDGFEDDPASWKARCLYINSLAKSRMLPAAIAELRNLVAIFPPLQLAPRSSSEASRLLDRLDTGRYPAPTFQHLSTLYSRLVESRDKKDHRFLLWALNAYGAQRKIIAKQAFSAPPKPAAALARS